MVQSQAGLIHFSSCNRFIWLKRAIFSLAVYLRLLTSFTDKYYSVMLIHAPQCNYQVITPRREWIIHLTLFTAALNTLRGHEYLWQKYSLMWSTLVVHTGACGLLCVWSPTEIKRCPLLELWRDRRGFVFLCIARLPVLPSEQLEI